MTCSVGCLPACLVSSDLCRVPAITDLTDASARGLA